MDTNQYNQPQYSTNYIPPANYIQPPSAPSVNMNNIQNNQINYQNTPMVQNNPNQYVNQLMVQNNPNQYVNQPMVQNNPNQYVNQPMVQNNGRNRLEQHIISCNGQLILRKLHTTFSIECEYKMGATMMKFPFKGYCGCGSYCGLRNGYHTLKDSNGQPLLSFQYNTAVVCAQRLAQIVIRDEMGSIMGFVRNNCSRGACDRAEIICYDADMNPVFYIKSAPMCSCYDIMCQHQRQFNCIDMCYVLTCPCLLICNDNNCTSNFMRLPYTVREWESNAKVCTIDVHYQISPFGPITGYTTSTTIPINMYQMSHYSLLMGLHLYIGTNYGGNIFYTDPVEGCIESSPPIDSSNAAKYLPEIALERWSGETD